MASRYPDRGQERIPPVRRSEEEKIIEKNMELQVKIGNWRTIVGSETESKTQTTISRSRYTLEDAKKSLRRKVIRKKMPHHIPAHGGISEESDKDDTASDNNNSGSDSSARGPSPIFRTGSPANRGSPNRWRDPGAQCDQIHQSTTVFREQITFGSHAVPGSDRSKGGFESELSARLDRNLHLNEGPVNTPKADPSAAVTMRDRRGSREHQQRHQHDGSPRPMNPPKLPAYLNKVADKLLDHHTLELMEVIGSGQFGTVRKAILKNEDRGDIQTVAVKTLTVDSAEASKQAVEEALLMKDFHDPNVLGLIGVAIGEKSTPMIVTHFMARGSLLDYLRAQRGVMPFEEMLKYGVQVARGMAYLTRQKLVHRDLAARNCMLNAEGQVKVADFGMTRAIIGKDYYRPKSNGPVPICWMALESLENNIFTVKSDVWSYGVVMWEITSGGRPPYGNQTTYSIHAQLLRGDRLPRPESCSEELYSIMLGCWDRNPDGRLDFDELVGLVDCVNPSPQEQ